MIKTIIKTASIGAITLLLTGCVQMPQPKTPEQIVQESSYQEVTRNVISKIVDKKYSKSYFQNAVVIEQYISGEKGQVDGSINEARNEYLNRYDSSNDEISKVFIESAKQRGNTVKMYKSSVNTEIIKYIPSSILPYRVNGNPMSANDDNAFVEYNQDNRIVSVLVRLHTYPKSLGTMHYRYSIIAYGTILRQIESSVGNNVLENGYITTIK